MGKPLQNLKNVQFCIILRDFRRRRCTGKAFGCKKKCSFAKSDLVLSPIQQQFSCEVRGNRQGKGKGPAKKFSTRLHKIVAKNVEKCV